MIDLRAIMARSSIAQKGIFLIGVHVEYLMPLAIVAALWSGHHRRERGEEGRAIEDSVELSLGLRCHTGLRTQLGGLGQPGLEVR